MANPWNLIAVIPPFADGVVLPGIDWTTSTALPYGGQAVQWGVKAVWYPAGGAAIGVDSGTQLWIVEMIDGKWSPMQQVSASFTDASVTAGGGPDAYIANVVQPAIKAWAAQRFSAAGVVQQPTVAVSLKLPGALVSP